MGKRRGLSSSALAALSAAICIAPVCLAQTLSGFCKDGRAPLATGADAGYGADAYAQLLVRHRGEHIPDKLPFSIQNAPGGGLTSANRLYNGAAREASVIGGTSAERVIIGCSGLGAMMKDLRFVDEAPKANIDISVISEQYIE